ncbi:5650_t:CDS:2 [Diversispora eburnea]|uniref:1-phosphatidylinositol-3-phosphate 5-kinase n=1 Tax=Diversispora eburnea TaxID=1213867 RepID=A0A9N8ZGB4_9GLOM|nr:5650_t:CDS:2 [Diversispora eburnea]
MTSLQVDNSDITTLTSFDFHRPFEQDNENVIAKLFHRVKSSFTNSVPSHSTKSNNALLDSHDNCSIISPPLSPKFTPSSPLSSSPFDKVNKNFSIQLPPPPPVINVIPPFLENANTLTPLIDLEDGIQDYTESNLIYNNSDNDENENNNKNNKGDTSDTRSIRSTASFGNNYSISKVMRRLRGEGVNKDHWMSDDTCKSCYDCKANFTIYRRKHHCRQIFCSKCASNIIPGEKFNHEGSIRVCDFCSRIMREYEDSDPGMSEKKEFTYPPRPPSPDTLSLNDGIKKIISVASSSLFMSRSRSNTITEEPQHPSSSSSTNGLPTPPVPFRQVLISEYAGSDDEFEFDPRLKSIHKQRPPPPSSFSSNSSITRRLSHTHPIRMSRSYLRPITTNIMQPIEGSDSRPSSPFRHVRTASLPVKVEINTASQQHMRKLLRQFLRESEIDLSEGWEEVIMKLMIEVSNNLNPNVRNGDDIDIRHYVKIKKIPGGTPKDSEYVHGVVCAKNLAHKKMPRILHNPKILILTFALEYHRIENQLMSLEPVIAQEEQHLRNLVNRISAFAPNLVLVEKTVARKALQFLLEKKIAVAINVKPSVIEAVARCARADIIPSIDIALAPNLGECGAFSVKTFVHQLIPGRRKTYLFFENCPKKLGCTIVIRGGDLETLKKIKRITDLMVFVVYNLKLESSLISDQYSNFPLIIQSNDKNENEKNVNEDAILKPYQSTILSVSPFIKFPPPYLLTKMKQAEQRLKELSLKRNGLSGGFKDNEKTHSSSSSINGILRTPEQVVAEGEFCESIHEQMLQTRAWENYTYNNVVSPYAHQNIAVLFTKICIETKEPCNGPEILLMEYYRESDRTLGQYLEETFSRSSYLCRTCERPMILHYHVFCHGNARIIASIEETDVSQLVIEPNIYLLTHCKKCNLSTDLAPMSDETWKYSFGKYLELSFYQTQLKSQLENCTHDVFREHELLFHFNGLVIRFEYEPIELLEIFPPPMTLYTKPEVHIRLKNQDLDDIRNKITNYWDSVTDRIKNFNYDIVQTDKVEGCKQELLEMSRRVVTEKNLMLQKLKQTYINSTPEDSLALNNVMYLLQEKVVAWDKDFNEFARHYFPRLTAGQLARFFVDNHEVITLGRGHSGTLLNDLPLINMDFDTGANSEKLDEEGYGPTIFPKLGSSPMEDFIRDQFKDLDYYQDDKIESLENDIEKANSQMSMFPFMDPKVSRRLSMKWMKESKNGRRQKKNNRTTSEAIFTSIIDKTEESIDYSQYPETIPRLLPTTVRQRSSRLAPKGLPSFEKPSESERNQLVIQNRSNRPPNSRPTRLPFVPEKDNNVTLKLSTLKRNQNIPFERSAIPRSSSSRQFKLTKNPVDNYGLSPLRTHENSSSRRRMSGLRKQKRTKKTVLPTKPTIEVFNNSEAATAEESDEEEFGESADDEHDTNSDDEIKFFSLNSTDAFDESLGNEEFFPLPGREPLNESYMYHSALAFLGQDLNEPTAPVTYPQDTFNGTGRVIPLVRSLANLWTDKKHLNPLDYPLNQTEHVFPDSSIIVREDEPSSIIAFSLSSHEYLEKLKSMQPSYQKNEAFMPDEDRRGANVSNWGLLDADENNDAEDGLISHMKYQFSGGSTHLFCKIFCAEQFDNLRRKCGCESTYIQSLARCVKWDSSGGKSGSAFLKTRDDRLVMKQISRHEVDAFVKFAPRYFEYMTNALIDVSL